MKVITLIILFVLFTVPALGFTGSQIDRWQEHDLSDQPGMSPDGDKYMLGVDEVVGVKCVAYLNDVQEVMTKYGLKKTHHIMVTFQNMTTGKAIETGLVEVIVLDPDGSLIEKVSLLAMDRAFGTDITLVKKGTYRLEIRTVLPDGVERTFQHKFVN